MVSLKLSFKIMHGRVFFLYYFLIKKSWLHILVLLKKKKKTFIFLFTTKIQKIFKHILFFYIYIFLALQ